MEKVKASFEIPKDLWREFGVHAKINATTCSKLLRNAIRKTLNKPESELEEIKE